MIFSNELAVKYSWFGAKKKGSVLQIRNLQNDYKYVLKD